jgi:hypothetical protein
VGILEKFALLAMAVGLLTFVWKFSNKPMWGSNKLRLSPEERRAQFARYLTRLRFGELEGHDADRAIYHEDILVGGYRQVVEYDPVLRRHHLKLLLNGQTACWLEAEGANTMASADRFNRRMAELDGMTDPGEIASLARAIMSRLSFV